MLFPYHAINKECRLNWSVWLRGRYRASGLGNTINIHFAVLMQWEKMSNVAIKGRKQAFRIPWSLPRPNCSQQVALRFVNLNNLSLVQFSYLIYPSITILSWLTRQPIPMVIWADYYFAMNFKCDMFCSNGQAPLYNLYMPTGSIHCTWEDLKPTVHLLVDGRDGSLSIPDVNLRQA